MTAIRVSNSVLVEAIVFLDSESVDPGECLTEECVVVTH